MKKAISVLVSAAMAVSMLAGTAATVSADEAAGKALRYDCFGKRHLPVYRVGF